MLNNNPPTKESVTKLLSSLSTLQITIHPSKILHIAFNRPKHLNALNEILFTDLHTFFSQFESTILPVYDIRVIILSGNGKAFSSGLDLRSNFAMSLLEFKNENRDIGRNGYTFYNVLKKLQEGLNLIEKCPVPVIAAVHSYCLGGALSILTCADIKICSNDAKFSIKEIDIGLTADLGALQRLVKQTGKLGMIKRYSYTGEVFNANQALNVGVVEEVVDGGHDMLIKRAFQLGEEIAAKSPLVLWGVKRTINFSRENNLETSLDMIATLNSALIQAGDIGTAIEGFMMKKKPVFPKL